MEKRNWSGFVINIPDQHCLVITGLWKPEKPESGWWWKCRDCFDSAGVMSTIELERLEGKGMISGPDGNTEYENSRHPKEEQYGDYSMYDGWWG